MARIITVIIVVTIILVVFGGVEYSVLRQVQAPKNADNEVENTHSAYSNIAELYGDLSKIQTWADDSKKLGGISSHHFFVSNKIASFLAGLKINNPEVIVILGPNHFGAGGKDILVSKYDYQTPWGRLENDKDLGDKLVNSGIAANEEVPFEREHSISALAGFIKYYLPDVKIVPIIIKLNVGAQKAQALSEQLNDILSQNSFVLASVDFSHHTTFFQANEWDKKTAEVLKDFDFSQIYDCQMDSHASIYALLKYLQLRGAKDMRYINLNSAQLMNNLDFQDVTSYFFAYFGKNN